MKARQAMIKVLGLMVASTALTAHAGEQSEAVNKAAPALSAPADQVISAGHPVTYVYAITAPASGIQTYKLAGRLVADNLDQVSGSIIFAQGETPLNAVTLGAVLATEGVDAGAATIKVLSDGVASGGVNGIGNGDTVVVGGKPYTILSVTDDAMEATLVLDSTLAAPLAEGELVAEQQTFTAAVASVGSVKNASQPASLSMHVSVESAADAVVSASDNTFTSVIGVEFSRLVRNVSRPNGAEEGTVIHGETFYHEPGVVTGVSGDIFEYALVVQAGASLFEGVTLTDAIPAYTSYVPASTTVNGQVVADVDGQSPLLGGLLLAPAAGMAAGVLPRGQAVTVLYRVKVD